jgi:hypothetical protein
VADDEAGGDERVCHGLVEVPHGVRIAEVREEAGQEGEEAVERSLGHVHPPGDGEIRFSIPQTQLRKTFFFFFLCGEGHVDEGVDDDVGDGVEETQT